MTNWLAVGALCAAGIACSKDATPPPSFADSTGEAPKAVTAYPAAPYGVNVGSVVEDFGFYGYAAPQLQTTTLQSLRLADFYNPHGRDSTYKPAAGAPDDRYFPSTSPFANAGMLKPTVLLIEVGCVWCGPCNAQAGTIMPVKHPLYAPCGGEFLLQLADGPSVGVAATPDNLQDWILRYGLDYPATIDPSGKLGPLFQESAYPQNIVIDTTTMKIAEVQVGEATIGVCGTAPLANSCAKDSDCAGCFAADGSGSACTDKDTSCVCADASTCKVAADCTGKTCTTAPFWTAYEALLDKTRSGCVLQ